MTIYQFYAELEGFEPKIWRRFQVDGNITVAMLGYTVMAMYEMRAQHLLAIEHECPILTASGRKSSRMELIARYGISMGEDDDYDSEDEDATITKLSQLNLEKPNSLCVWYDFGDGWRVRLSLEQMEDNSQTPKNALPLILEGRCFGIVEDCGGIYGLENLAEAFKTKQGDEYEDLREWLGVDEFDITAFEKDEMNSRIKKLPVIFAKIYEKSQPPTQKEIKLIERL